MQDYPHIYKASADGGPEGILRVDSPGLESIATTAPPEFGGPEGTWSPETLLVASVADCFILTFRAIARASKFEWSGLQVAAEGKLERVDRVTQFTAFTLFATLRVATTDQKDKAVALLQKAEDTCLITNSMTAEVHLETNVEVATGN